MTYEKLLLIREQKAYHHSGDGHFAVGDPMPTSPFLSSKVVESPMYELLLVSPAYFVRWLSVPLPCIGKVGALSCVALLFLAAA